MEEIGVNYEEPMSLLPLEQLCENAEEHITGMLLMDASSFDLAVACVDACDNADHDTMQPPGTNGAQAGRNASNSMSSV